MLYFGGGKMITGVLVEPRLIGQETVLRDSLIVSV